MKNKIGLMTIFLVSIIAMCGIASALNIDGNNVVVKVNGDVVSETSSTEIYDFDKDQDLTVKVRVEANENIFDVQIEASIRGYDHNDLMEDITDVFDMKEGRTYTKTLKIPLRLRMDQDQYRLSVRIENRNGESSVYDYQLEIDTKRHSMMIKDIILFPENEVKAGRTLRVAVRLKNYGERDEKGIKIRASIPELGISATDYVEELEKEDEDNDDETTTEELYLGRIPDNTPTGEYILRVEVTYDDGDEKEVEEMIVRVKGVEEEVTEEKKEKTLVRVAGGSQSATQGGAEAVYPITIANEGDSSMTYIISADGADWATFRISPSNVLVVGAGDSEAVNVYVAAKSDAPVGEQTFVVTVKAGDDVEEIPMKVSISQASSSTFAKLKRGLEIGALALVVLLVILGLIIGFNKLKGDEEEPKEEGETYY